MSQPNEYVHFEGVWSEGQEWLLSGEFGSKVNLNGRIYILGRGFEDNLPAVEGGNVQINKRFEKMEDNKDETNKSVSAFPNHFLGYRQFKITDDLELRSCGVNARWIPGKNIARCTGTNIFAEPKHIAPVKECQCGLYAVHDPKYFSYSNSENKNWFSLDISNDPVVAAAIQAWGPMEIHATGFRAKYAQVALLAYDMSEGPGVVEKIKAVADRYKVRAVDTTEFLDESNIFGDVVPKDQRPEDEIYQLDSYNELMGVWMERQQAMARIIMPQLNELGTGGNGQWQAFISNEEF